MSQETTAADVAWFDEARFGMFIHWGLYALPARHEWVRHNERISNEEYQKYFDHFEPDLFNPREWAKAAKNAGMKYFVITTKHHDGFCLWDTKQTDYKAPNTPIGRDLLKEMVEAFREEGLHVGLYHSLIDWHHPDYEVVGDNIHPMRENKEFLEANKNRDHKKYTEYLHAQVKELLTEYGKIDVIWFDFSYPEGGGPNKGHEGWNSHNLIKMVRELQPGIIVNDRLDIKDTPGGMDIETPEQRIVRRWPERDGKKLRWEACHTFSGSWGYHRDEESWKSPEQCVEILIDSVSKGGNLLMNVGPTGRGNFDQRAIDRLNNYGEWMALHSRSIYGCTEAPEEFKAPEGCKLTYNPETNRLYIHILSWPFKTLVCDELAKKLKYAQLLNDASEIRFSLGSGDDAETTLMSLPIKRPNVIVPVIECYLQK